MTTEEHEEDDARGPDIHFLSVLIKTLLTVNLGSGRVKCAGLRSHVVLAILLLGGDVEV